MGWKRRIFLSFWFLVINFLILPKGYSGQLRAENAVDERQVMSDLGQEFSREDVEIIENLELLESLEFLEEDTAFLDNYEVLDDWDGTKNTTEDRGEIYEK